MVRSPVGLRGGPYVQLAYLTPERAWLIDVECQAGDRLQDVIERSGLVQQVPGLDLMQAKVGVFGRLCELNAAVNPGDRIEIYRPLLADPKVARRLRAAKSKRIRAGARPD